jgi:hypothetical protein
MLKVHIHIFLIIGSEDILLVGSTNENEIAL